MCNIARMESVNVDTVSSGTGSERKYYLRLRFRINRMIMIPIYLAVAIALIYAMVLLTIRMGTTLTGVIILVILILVLSFNLVSRLFILTFSTGLAFFTYVKVSHDGLEYHFWPYAVRCNWEHVDIKHDRYVPAYDKIHLKQAEPVELGQLARVIRRVIPWPRRVPSDLFALGSFRGYPDGPLADDLWSYAPHLFPDS